MTLNQTEFLKDIRNDLRDLSDMLRHQVMDKASVRDSDFEALVKLDAANELLNQVLESRREVVES